MSLYIHLQLQLMASSKELLIPMRLRLLLPLLLAGLAAFAMACSDDDDNSATGATGPMGTMAGRLFVASSVSPITSIAENIGGTKITLVGIVPEGTNSHTFEPPVSVVQTLVQADIIIINGLQLEEPLLNLAEANRKDGAVILQVGDMTIDPDEYKYDFSFPEDEGKPNPHLWPEPFLALAYAEHIKNAFVQADAANADYYEANYEAFEARINQLDEAIKTVVATIPEENRKLLTYHDSWAYFAERYGMTVIGAVQPSDFSEPSAREVAQLIDQVRDEQVPAVFGSEVFPSPVLEQIAREGGAEFVDELADDDLPGEPGEELHSYIGLMIQNMRIMAPALGGDASAMDNVDASLVFTDGPSNATYPQ
jgi:ABC-type Zn uptake system ZnuABC Zn-binding protein ZnuA